MSISPSYETILKLIPANIYWKGIDGRYLGCNQHMAEILRLPNCEAIVGKTIYELEPYSYPENKVVSDVINQTDIDIMNKGERCSIEEEGFNLKGERATFVTTKIPLFNEQNEVSGLLGISVDISQRKHREEVLQSQSERLQGEKDSINVYLSSILQSSPGHIYWMDSEGRIIGCNEQQAKCFGMTAQELMGKNIFDVGKALAWPKEVSEKIHQNDLEIMRTGNVQLMEEMVVLDGEEKVYLSQKAPLATKEGKVIGVVGISNDITKQKRIETELKEQAERSHRVKSEFIANMSHDLRTPLMGVLGMAELIDRSSKEPKIKEYSKDILASATVIKNLLNEILETMQLDVNHHAQFNETFSIRRLLKVTKCLLISEVKRKNITLDSVVDQQVPAFFEGNRLYLHRVLLNLVGNAVKFTDSGRISIEVKELKREGGVSTIVIAVRDAGPGIAKNRQEEIFELFTRLTPSYEGGASGPGLGLYIVKQCLKSLEGEITVESKLGKGSVFTVVLPLKIASQATVDDVKDSLSNADMKKKSPPATDFSTVSVLLIEDNDVAEKVARLNLREFDCQVDVALCGETAFKKLQSKDYDLILMDVGLPDINGYMLTEKIRVWEHKHHTIVGLSAHVSEEHKQRCREVAMDAVYSKPLDFNMMQEILDRYVNRDVTSDEV